MDSLPINYREFWDVPRSFIVSYEGSQYLFDCAFDDAADDYPEFYLVYELPVLSDSVMDGSWNVLPGLAARTIGTVPVADVHFDSTKRKSIDSSILISLLESSKMATV